MSRLLDLATSIWENSVKVNFGNEGAWSSDSLQYDWFTSKGYKEKWTSQSPGWYWFICEIDFTDLQRLGRPDSLPANGCNFGVLSKKNIKVFSEETLCKPNQEGLVIYNGHEGSVTKRIRAHFALNNNNTGALGIKHYPLPAKKWEVRFFTKLQVHSLHKEDQDIVARLIESPSGRAAIENAWRMKYGWPILCKQ